MKKRIFSILLVCCMVLALLPTTAFAAGEIDEQFTLAPGGTYYFDLSAMGIPGTVNGSLPDASLHYVPFTYAGTVDAYKLTSEMATTEEYAETYKYAHSLFVADYAVTYAASWDHLNAIDMIFGKDYAAGGVDYTLRAPSEGSDYTGSGDSERGTPQSNEWDRLLDKDDGYIKNWNGIFSCGQDSVIRLSWRRTVRGHYSSRFCGHRDAAGQNPQVGFRPVLEVLNHDTIGPDGLKAVALDLGGGKLGDESSIRIIVKNGSAFTAPSGDGLTRPEGATGNYFKWLGSDDKLYAPGDSVPADVTTLTARFVPDTYTVIVTTDTLPDGKTGKAYSHTLTAISTAPITWRIDEGVLPAGLRLNEKTGEISGIPTAAGTATFTVKAENSEGSDTRALSITVNNAVEQTPVRYLDADGKERFCTEYTVLESVIIEDFFNSDNKWYDMPAGWYVVEGDVTITPRLDTHGAVNLILKDDCHLTVPWGINVKEGDTFTIYAQSTAEASMGKLTACLPELSDHEKSVWPVAGLSGIGAGVRVWAANDNYYENEGTIIINGGNIHAKGQQGSSAIGGSDYDCNVSSDGDTPGNLRQGGSITINGGIVCTELRTSGGAHTADSFGIGTCGGNGGSVTINGGTIIAEASSSAISSGRGGSITINGGNVTAHGGINRYENQPLYAIPGNGIGPLEGGSITINGGTVKASSEGDGFGIGGAGVHHTAEMHITINDGNIETTANRNNAAIGDKSKHKSSVTITGGVIHAVGKGSAAGIGSTGDIRITGGEISVFAEGGGAAIGSIGGVDCKSITINGNAIKSISSKDGACIGGAAGGSIGSITISDAALPLLSAEKILIGWDADSPGGKLTIRNCHVESTDTLSVLTDGIRVGSNSELVIENSEIRLPHFRSIRVGGNGSIAVRDSALHTYGIFMDETVQSPNDAKTLKKLEITNSTVLTGDIIGARGGYSSVDEVVIHGSSIRLNDEYTYNYCTIGGGTNGSFGSIDIQNSQIHIPSSGGNTAIGNGWQVYYNRESRIRIANSEVSVRCASLGPAIGAAWDSGSGRINILIENSTVTAKGGNLRTDGNYVPGIGKNALGRAPEIGIQILNSTVDSFRLTEKGGTDYVYDDLHTKELPGIPAENISICGSTVNGTRIEHSFDEYGKCAICGKYDLGYCYEHGLLTMEGLTDCVSDGSEKKLTGLSHKTGENETKQLAENTDYTASYSNNVHPYTLKPDDAGFDSEKAPKVTLYGTGNYCGKAEHYFTISTEAPAAEHTVTVRTDGNGTASASHAKAAAGTEITLTATPNEGYHFKEWEVMSGGVTIKDDKFTMPSANVEVKAIFKDMSKEQFTLAPGGTYYFDLSAMGIPGTVNDALPDKTMRYVPFTYAGTVDAYKLMSEMATTEEYAEQNKYDHSLFVADFAVTHAVSWDNLNAEGLIFGKGYAAGSVDYTLRAPSGGSGGTGSGALERGTPQSNEWDRILDKDDGYIKNWRNIGSWGQDTLPNTLSNRVIRGRYDLPRKYAGANTTLSFPFLGFRPVLEVLNPGTLGSDGLKAVTLDLGGGKLGGSSDTIQIIVKTGESFTAPASEGLTRPDGNTGSYFEWLGSDGELYAPDDNVPADVTKLTAQFVPPEQFNLAPDGTYYFDLSGVSIPGTVNGSLPDSTLHYVPFTYAGTVDAYALTSEMATTDEYAQENNYDHSLFIADYNVTHTVSWDDLNTAGLIFDKDYAAGGVDYTLRAPSAGSSSTGPSFSIHGAPQSNEWDRILDKDERYIQNIVGLYSWGQDTPSASASQRVGRGYYPLRGWSSAPASYQTADAGFRPVLEVLGLDKLGYDGLKAVTLDLGGGKLGNSSEDIQIIVKSGESFAAPASDGLTRPDGNTDNYFKWLGSDGELYEPGDNVSADVTKLAAQFAPSSHSVTITTDTLPDGKVGEAYSQTLTATGTTPITWNIIGGALPDVLNLNEATGEISGTPTADGTAKFTVKAENSAGSDTKELSITITKDAPTEHTITVTNDGNGTASASSTSATAGTEITLTAMPNEGYRFKEWQAISGDVTIVDDKFTMPDSNVEVKAIFEEDAPPAPTEHTVTVTSGGNGTASASPSKAVAGAEITLSATPDKGYHLKEWQVESPTGLVVTNNKFTMPDSNVEVKAIFEEDAPPAPTEYTITVTNDGNGTASASHAKAVVGTEIRLTAKPDEGYRFKKWEVMSGNVTIKDDKFTMPSANVEVKAVFEKDAPAPTDPAKPSISVTGTYTYNGSEHTATVSGYDPATMDISGNTATDAGDYTVRVTSKTGKWADGSTDAVTAAWSIGKATQEAPNGLIGVAPTTEGGSDGKITGVDATMEYRAESEITYTACTGIEIENLPAGNYFVRYAEDHNHFASPDTVVTVGDGAQLADCTITFNAGGGSGSMGPVIVKAETNYILPACGFTAPADQEFKAWEIGGTEYKVGDSYTVNGDIEIKALWKNSVITPTTYTVTVSNDGNGTGTAAPSTAAAGTMISLTATPNEGYRFKEWQVISGGVAIKDDKFLMPNDNVEVKAIFEEDAPPVPTEFTITVKTDGNGTASASHAKAVVGTEIALTATPDKGYHFKEWQVVSPAGLVITNNKFTMPDSNVEVTAIFEKDAPPAPTEFIVTFDGNGGTPSVGSMTTTNRKLTSLPSASRRGSYSFDGWYTEKSGGTKITTATVFSANTTVYAHWTYIGSYTPPVRPRPAEDVPAKHPGFVDAPVSSYFYEAVMWAVERGITTGVSANRFDPNGVCTRAQAVTFLWRAAGSPAPRSRTMPFTDVPTGSYYYDAVLWAVENGITKGTSDTTFSPNMTCTRAQIVAFLWRSEKSPAAGSRNPFADVKSTAYYAGAVLWAVREDITKGTTSTTFSPDADCTRAQIVTFLWRCKK